MAGTTHIHGLRAGGGGGMSAAEKVSMLSAGKSGEHRNWLDRTAHLDVGMLVCHRRNDDVHGTVKSINEDWAGVLLHEHPGVFFNPDDLEPVVEDDDEPAEA